MLILSVRYMHDMYLQVVKECPIARLWKSN